MMISAVALRFLLLVFFLLSGGIWFSRIGRRYQAFIFLLGLIAFLSTIFFIRDRWNEVFSINDVDRHMSSDIRNQEKEVPHEDMGILIRNLIAANQSDLGMGWENIERVSSIGPWNNFTELQRYGEVGFSRFTSLNLSIAGRLDRDEESGKAAIWMITAYSRGFGNGPQFVEVERAVGGGEQEYGRLRVSVIGALSDAGISLSKSVACRGVWQSRWYDASFLNQRALIGLEFEPHRAGSRVLISIIFPSFFFARDDWHLPDLIEPSVESFVSNFSRLRRCLD